MLDTVPALPGTTLAAAARRRVLSMDFVKSLGVLGTRIL